MTKPNRIRAIVARLLEDPAGQARPLPIDRLIFAEGIDLVRRPFDDSHDVSGFYLKDGDRRIIGVNSNHPPVRQRFTMAHELGHALLHPQEGLHLDQAFMLRFRDEASSTGVDPDEVAANRFAAELLMPLDEVLARVTKEPFDINDDAAVKAMAKVFGVSSQAMTIRLTSLGAVVDGTPTYRS